MKPNTKAADTRIRASAINLLAGISLAAISAGTLAGPGGTYRPFAGSCNTVVTPLNQTFPLLLHIDLFCSFRHLGLTTGAVTQVVTPVGPPINGVVPLAISAQATYVAANGDVLLAAVTGSGTQNLITGEAVFSGSETYQGGTGRFVDATGGSTFEGTASAVTSVGFFASKGEISY